MPGYWCLLLLPLGAAAGNYSSLAEVTVSSQALRVRGGEPPGGERAEVRPMPRARPPRGVSGEEAWRASPGARTQGSEEPPRVESKDPQSGPTRDSRTLTPNEAEEGRGHMKKLKKQFKKIAPYLMVPGMMALGYAPFILASLKMFVMNALTLNMMAFNAAIFMTLRNMVFGPRKDEHIKYYNFGYKKKHDHHNHPHGR